MSTSSVAGSPAQLGSSSKPAANKAQAHKRPLVDVKARTEELGDVFDTFAHHYGPIDAKKALVGVNWEALREKYLGLVGKLTNDRDFYTLVSQLQSELNDAHVSISIPTSRQFKLPLQFNTTQGSKIVVGCINSDYPPMVRRPNVGDELVAINKMNPDTFQAQWPQFNADANDITNKDMFALGFSDLREGRGLDLERFPGKLDLTFKDHTDGSLYTVSLPYEKTGVGIIGPGKNLSPKDIEQLTAVQRPGSATTSALGGTALTAEQRQALDGLNAFHVKFHDLFDLSTPSVNALTEEGPAVAEGVRIQLGHVKPLYPLPEGFKQIEPPETAKDILNASSIFAGTFEKEGKRIGLLRIPAYGGSSPATLSLTLRYYFAELQKNSDVLVIDQTDNPGGYVSYSDLVIRALTGHWDEKKHMKFAVRPSQRFLRRYAQMIADINTVGLSQGQTDRLLKQFRSDYAKIAKAFETGQHLSKPISLLGFTEIMEAMTDQQLPLFQSLLGTAYDTVNHPQHYTKPVFFWTNSRCFSGGDATPANFQDYQRGKIVGTRTAGAGGTVEEFSHREGSEFDMRLTTSLMVRPGGKLVENLGVTPDIPFEITQQDIVDGYKDVLPRLLKTVGITKNTVAPAPTAK